MKRGWKTYLPDGSIATTECDGGDCLKYGWTTSLPTGRTVDCDCGGACVTDGADCE